MGWTGLAAGIGFSRHWRAVKGKPCKTTSIRGMQLIRGSSQTDQMKERNPHARYCPHCGEQFGHAWGGVGLQAHLWKVHGIPGEARFNGKVVRFPMKDTDK
tara:strand:+ start:219 stop:521 length:303 start_codon:yes stop_codon:yes gene_type:complete